MSKHIFLLALLSLLSYASCKNRPTPPPQPAPPTENNEDGTKASEPDPNDLLHTLQGRWQSEQDPGYTLEIADTQMRHFNQGKLTYESVIEVDGACTGTICKPDGVDTSDGWCFTEMPKDQQQFATQCNFVTLCDTMRLQYRALSGPGNVLSFKKIP